MGGCGNNLADCPEPPIIDVRVYTTIKGEDGSSYIMGIGADGQTYSVAALKTLMGWKAGGRWNGMWGTNMPRPWAIFLDCFTAPVPFPISAAEWERAPNPWDIPLPIDNIGGWIFQKRPTANWYNNNTQCDAGAGCWGIVVLDARGRVLATCSQDRLWHRHDQTAWEKTKEIGSAGLKLGALGLFLGPIGLLLGAGDALAAIDVPGASSIPSASDLDRGIHNFIYSELPPSWRTAADRISTLAPTHLADVVAQNPMIAANLLLGALTFPAGMPLIIGAGVQFGGLVAAELTGLPPSLTTAAAGMFSGSMTANGLSFSGLSVRDLDPRNFSLSKLNPNQLKVGLDVLQRGGMSLENARATTAAVTLTIQDTGMSFLINTVKAGHKDQLKALLHSVTALPPTKMVCLDRAVDSLAQQLSATPHRRGGHYDQNPNLFLQPLQIVGQPTGNAAYFAAINAEMGRILRVLTPRGIQQINIDVAATLDRAAQSKRTAAKLENAVWIGLGLAAAGLVAYLVLSPPRKR